LHPAVEIADDALGAAHLFAVELEDDALHAVGGGVLRPHVKNQFVGVEECMLALVEIEMGGACRPGRFGHWPLSIPRLICTHSWSCWMMLWSLRRGKPFQSSGRRMRRRSGWPSKRMPNIS